MDKRTAREIVDAANKLLLEWTKGGMMSEWISVKDQLPENDSVVFAWSTSIDALCEARYGSISTGEWRVVGIAGNEGALLDWDVIAANIVYWQPLPEPPKTDGPFSIDGYSVKYQSNTDIVWFLGQRSQEKAEELVNFLNQEWLKR